jgi:ubiquinone/menaquinone biosynthesis C-methylase UbiE
LFVKCSRRGKAVKRFRASHQALELIYTYSWEATQGKKLIERLLTHILFHFANARAVRNRLRLVKKELRRVILSFPKKEITIASLGSGSARAIIETVAELIEEDVNCKFTVVLVDASENALRYSELLAKEYGIADFVEWVRVKGLLEEFVNNSHDYPPDIVEMVGVMDYFDEETAIEVLSKIYEILSSSGVLITCNIRQNIERIFLERVLRWQMIYREPEDLADLILLSGFKEENIEIIYEPLKIHGLVVAHKMPFGAKT